MDNLLKLLNEIPDECFGKEPCPNGILYSNGSHEYVNTIDELACELLIDQHGQPNYANIQILNEHGYHVYADEEDSFGWILGVIEYPDKRAVVFG